MTIDLNLINQDNLKPRAEVRIEALNAAPYPDGQRVKVAVRVTPFRERPNLEIALYDAAGHQVAKSHIIGAMTFSMALTLHLRGVTQPAGSYTVRGTLYYDDLAAPQHQRETPFTIAPPGA